MQFKIQLHEIHEEISEWTQKQLQAFAENNPEIKQITFKPDPDLKRWLFFKGYVIMKKKKEVPREQDFPCRAVKDGGRY